MVRWYLPLRTLRILKNWGHIPYPTIIAIFPRSPATNIDQGKTRRRGPSIKVRLFGYVSLQSCYGIHVEPKARIWERPLSHMSYSHFDGEQGHTKDGHGVFCNDDILVPTKLLVQGHGVPEALTFSSDMHTCR